MELKSTKTIDEERFGKTVETSQYWRDISNTRVITSFNDGKLLTVVFEDIHTTTRSQEVFEAIKKDYPSVKGMILGGVLGVRIPCK